MILKITETKMTSKKSCKNHLLEYFFAMSELKLKINFSNPNRNPYGVISAALQDALDRDVQPYKLRPFLQGFWHTDFEVRENIRAAEDKDLGWLIWNVSSSYNLEYFSKIDS